jgi:hypothetical protein
MGSKRFESFKQVQILIVWKIFFNIPAQTFFGPVQTKITRHITQYVSRDYAVFFRPRKANPGVVLARVNHCQQVMVADSVKKNGYNVKGEGKQPVLNNEGVNKVKLESSNHMKFSRKCATDAPVCFSPQFV